MKSKKLLMLLPFLLAASYGSTALAIPATTAQTVGNSTLYVSGPVFTNQGVGPASGQDTADRPLTDLPVPPISTWEPGTYTVGVSMFQPDVNFVFEAAPTAVPEPSILLLAGLGLAALGLRRRRD